MSKKVALTTPNLIANNFASKAIIYFADTLDNDICSPSLQKWAADTVCMFLGGIILVSVTTSVEGSVNVSW